MEQTQPNPDTAHLEDKETSRLDIIMSEEQLALSGLANEASQRSKKNEPSEKDIQARADVLRTEGVNISLRTAKKNDKFRRKIGNLSSVNMDLADVNYKGPATNESVESNDISKYRDKRRFEKNQRKIEKYNSKIYTREDLLYDQAKAQLEKSGVEPKNDTSSKLQPFSESSIQSFSDKTRDPELGQTSSEKAFIISIDSLLKHGANGLDPELLDNALGDISNDPSVRARLAKLSVMRLKSLGIINHSGHLTVSGEELADQVSSYLYTDVRPDKQVLEQKDDAESGLLTSVQITEANVLIDRSLKSLSKDSTPLNKAYINNITTDVIHTLIGSSASQEDVERARKQLESERHQQSPSLNQSNDKNARPQAPSPARMPQRRKPTSQQGSDRNQPSNQDRPSSSLSGRLEAARREAAVVERQRAAEQAVADNAARTAIDS